MDAKPNRYGRRLKKDWDGEEDEDEEDEKEDEGGG
jgi:hypothetical protein